MVPTLHQARNGACWLATVLLGFGLALSLYDVWELETRWIVVVFTAIAAVAITFCLARVFADFLLAVLLLSLPLAAFCKWVWPSGVPANKYGERVMFGGFGFGRLDFLVAALYVNWFDW